MRWEIKPQWILKKKKYLPGHGYVWIGELDYFRIHRKSVMTDKIVIQSETKNGIEKMVEASFNAKNDKRPFRNYKIYYSKTNDREIFASIREILDSHYYGPITFAKTLHCSNCNKQLNVDELNWCPFELILCNWRTNA